MTSTPLPFDEHPDVADISALDEGVLPAEREPDVRAHLAECALCGDVRASLEEIRATLGALPGPVRMPEDVADRIDAALAAEALLGTATDTGAGNGTDTAAETNDAVSRETALQPLPSPAAADPNPVPRPDPAPEPTTDSEPTLDSTPALRSDQAPSSDPDPSSGLAPASASVRGGSAAPDETAPRNEVSSPGAVSRETRRAHTGPQPTRRRPGALHLSTPTSDRPSGHPSGTSGTSGPGRSAGGTGPGRDGTGDRRARRRRRTLLAAAASLAALALGGIVLQQTLSSPAPAQVSSDAVESAPRTQPPGEAPSATGSTTPDTDTGDDKGDQQLRKRVQRLLSDETKKPSASASTTPPAKPSESPTVGTKRSPGTDGNTLRDDAIGGGETIPSCVRDGIGRSETPLAVDPDATFANRTGYLVVLPHQGGDPRWVDAYLVDPSCVSADPAGPGKVLFKRTYPRG
ncbi:hypothetical protein FM076_16670 [Streptomyces albus subsp. chlorinus]|uniref:hypothetical protein n=1 Tax=Streptomyces albus TaxID=1888 RepID=UPI00156D6FC0|nr:hypothetical protein [Streptomyces albus]NSC22717.1 hypothetical protein [Streptomyces albus subsp. chlorinus]